LSILSIADIFQKSSGIKFSISSSLSITNCSTGDWTLPAAHVMVGSVMATATNMDVRISHHITMWLLVTWVVFHIYYQFWRTIFWKEGDVSIIVGGSKYVKIEDGENS